MDKEAQEKHEPLSFIVTGDGLADSQTAEKELQDINSENREKLAEMTKEEILEEQKKLESSLGMKLFCYCKLSLDPACLPILSRLSTGGLMYCVEVAFECSNA